MDCRHSRHADVTVTADGQVVMYTSAAAGQLLQSTDCSARHECRHAVHDHALPQEGAGGPSPAASRTSAGVLCLASANISVSCSIMPTAAFPILFCASSSQDSVAHMPWPTPLLLQRLSAPSFPQAPPPPIPPLCPAPPGLFLPHIPQPLFPTTPQPIFLLPTIPEWSKVQFGRKSNMVESPNLAQVIRERGAKVNQDSLRIMPYTDAVIKEALRLGAIINIVPKRALKTFEIGGYTIPKVSSCPAPCQTLPTAAENMQDQKTLTLSGSRCRTLQGISYLGQRPPLAQPWAAPSCLPAGVWKCNS